MWKTQAQMERATKLYLLMEVDNNSLKKTKNMLANEKSTFFLNIDKRISSLKLLLADTLFPSSLK